MLLTANLHSKPAGGRELLCKLNHDALRDLYGDDLIVHRLERVRPRNLAAVMSAFRGYIDGIDSTSINKVVAAVATENIEQVFVDGSNLGEAVRRIKRFAADVEVCTFFHNVEARFFHGSFRQRRDVHSAGVLLANYLAERKAVRWSDKIVCLSERDSSQLQKIYGRTATHISPLAVQDQAGGGAGDQRDDQPDEPYGLFVGGGFYANRAGIDWFMTNVAPRITTRVYVVGRGLDDLRVKSQTSGSTEVVGAVPDVAPWYRGARFVVAPIFDGSGMKTKVAEALMFGKKIIGTPEAFAGYEEIATRVGWVCNTADEFVAAVSVAKDADPFNEDLRALYEKRYSYAAARARLAEILE